MLYDTHCHPYLAKKLSEKEILENFFSGGGKYLNSIGCDIESSVKSIQLSKVHPGVYATIGIHPTHVLDHLNSDVNEVMNQFEELYKQNPNEIIGIGETGLDYYWLESLSERHGITQKEIVTLQKKYFKAQIRLAKMLDLPIIIHNRSSSQDVLEILKQEDCKHFVFHCFSEELQYAQRLISFAPDCKLGFGGVVTFKNAQITQEVVKNIDLNHIIIETDSPYLTPDPYRGKRENEPILCQEVLSKIIDLREEDSMIITKQIFDNSKDFFRV